MSKWKAGQLVTINGIVYRVKRSKVIWKTCSLCAFNCGYCELLLIQSSYAFSSGHYPIPYNCYFERVSPIIKIVR